MTRVTNPFKTRDNLSTSSTQGTTDTQDTPEVPFFPFVPRYPNFEGDLAVTGGDYILLNKTPATLASQIAPTAAESADPLKKHDTPIIFLSREVAQEIQFHVDYTANSLGECGFLMLSRPLNERNKRHILIYDYFLVNQEVTSTKASLDLEDADRYYNYLKENWPDRYGKNLAQNIQHGHSHGNMGVFFSPTDFNQQEDKTELGYQSDYRFYLCFNKAKQVYASMVMYDPVFFRVDDIPVGIYTGDAVPNSGKLTKARKKELTEKIDALVKPYTPPRAMHPALPASRYSSDHSFGAFSKVNPRWDDLEAAKQCRDYLDWDSPYWDEPNGAPFEIDLQDEEEVALMLEVWDSYKESTYLYTESINDSISLKDMGEIDRILDDEDSGVYAAMYDLEMMGFTQVVTPDEIAIRLWSDLESGETDMDTIESRVADMCEVLAPILQFVGELNRTRLGSALISTLREEDFNLVDILTT